MIPISDQLAVVINMKGGASSNTELSLAELSEAVKQLLPKECNQAFASVGKTTTLKLLANLRRICALDSVVRDVLTCGHLAKFLTRQDVLARTGNYNLVALPNRPMDWLSTSERARYFRSGRHLHVLTSAAEKQEARLLFAEEKPKGSGLGLP